MKIAGMVGMVISGIFMLFDAYSLFELQSIYKELPDITNSAIAQLNISLRLVGLNFVVFMFLSFT